MFSDSVLKITTEIAELLIEKNKAYGNSALNPVRIFSKSDTIEQINVRLDDKLSRLARGHEYPGDDTIRDLIGYLIILLIAKNEEENCKKSEEDVKRQQLNLRRILR